MPRVIIPQLGELGVTGAVQFPDEMTPEQITAAIEREILPAIPKVKAAMQVSAESGIIATETLRASSTPQSLAEARRRRFPSLAAEGIDGAEWKRRVAAGEPLLRRGPRRATPEQQQQADDSAIVSGLYTAVTGLGAVLSDALEPLLRGETGPVTATPAMDRVEQNRQRIRAELGPPPEVATDAMEDVIETGIDILVPTPSIPMGVHGAGRAARTVTKGAGLADDIDDIARAADEIAPSEPVRTNLSPDRRKTPRHESVAQEFGLPVDHPAVDRLVDADTDQLTGVLNRDAYQRAARSGVKPPHVSEVDIAGVGSMNQRWGEGHADAVLAATGRELQRIVGDRGTVYRKGGDEFVVHWNDSAAGAAAHAELATALSEAIVEVVEDGKVLARWKGVDHYAGDGPTFAEASGKVYDAKKLAKGGDVGSKKLPDGLAERIEAGTVRPDDTGAVSGSAGVRGSAEAARTGAEEVAAAERTVTLWRAEPIDETVDLKSHGPVSAPDTDAASRARGRGGWYTDSEADARYYLEQIGHAGHTGRIRKIELPESEARKYLAADHPEAARFSDNPEHEYFLPSEVRARSVVTQEPTGRAREVNLQIDRLTRERDRLYDSGDDAAARRIEKQLDDLYDELDKINEAEGAPTTSAADAPRELWQQRRAEAVGDEPDVAEVRKLPRLERIARENPERLTDADRKLLADMKKQRSARARSLKQRKEYVERSNAHLEAVRRALAEGKPVPDEVLDDYPFLRNEMARKADAETADTIRDAPPADAPKRVEDMTDDELRAAAKDNSRPATANAARVEMKKRGVGQKKKGDELPIVRPKPPAEEPPSGGGVEPPPDVQPLPKQRQIGAATPEGYTPGVNAPMPGKKQVFEEHGPVGSNRGFMREEPDGPEVVPDRTGYVPNERRYASSAPRSEFDPKRYVAEQKAKREAARGKSSFSMRGALKDLQRKFVDFAIPLEEPLKQLVKAGMKIAESKNITNYIDRVLRAPYIAGQLARDYGLAALLRRPIFDNLDNLDEFAEVLIARQARDVEATVFEPGEPVAILNQATGDVDAVRLGSKEARAAQEKATKFFERLVQRMARETGTRMSAQQIRELAEQVARENGLNLDEIPGARAGLVKIGKNTGRDLVQDQRLLEAVGNKYDAELAQWSAFTHKVLDYTAETGLISPELAARLKEIWPNYAPLNRIFSAAEEGRLDFGGRPVASLSRQTIVMRIMGSDRVIENPIYSMMQKLNDAVIQGERNQAARLLYSYKDLPGNPYQISAPHANSEMNVSFLDNGKKVEFGTTKEVAAAAKALNVQALGFWGKVFAQPTRIARAGITGLNLPFIFVNIPRDQLTGFINSAHGRYALGAWATKELYETLGHGGLYDELAREGVLFTSYDMARNALPQSVERLRAGSSAQRMAHYYLTHPSEWLHGIENVVGTSELFGRATQYIGAKKWALAQGMPEAEARMYAARIARESTVNFARRGEWGTPLNAGFLYINANIQGVRQLLRSFAARPWETIAKVGLTTLAPVGMLTAWNMSDPLRRLAYEDIADYEKEFNLIWIPPNPTQDERGRWNVVKIPLPHDVNNLTIPFRRGVEALVGGDPLRAMEVAGALLGSVSPINPTKGEALSTATPQLLKPWAEVATNVNFFTLGNIDPPQTLRLPAEMRGKPWVSATASEIADALGVSPNRVEHWFRATGGGVGMQVLHWSDTLQAGIGIIPDEAVGGEGAIAGTKRRFFKATGGERARRARRGGPAQTTEAGRRD